MPVIVGIFAPKLYTLSMSADGEYLEYAGEQLNSRLMSGNVKTVYGPSGKVYVKAIGSELARFA